MAQASHFSAMCGAPARSPPGSLPLLDILPPCLSSASGACPSDHFHTTVQAQLQWLKVMVKSGSLMEIAAHLTISLLPSSTDPIGPTTMPPSAFIASIPKQQVKSYWFTMYHQHADFSRTAFLHGHSYHSVIAARTRHASNHYHVHNCSPPRPASISINNCS